MVMPRINMDLQKEIQFLKPILKSKRKIAAHLGIHRETVSKYWEEQNNEQACSVKYWSDEIDWDYVRKEIKSGTSVKTLYKEFVKSQTLPTYPNFARYIRLHQKLIVTPEISLKVERVPGQSIEIDYSGDKMQILNISTGEIITAELFVAAMSFSGYFYAEFTLTQKTEDFIHASGNAFEYLGKVPRFIVSDNCKTAVTTAEKHDFILNKVFKDFCYHYNVIADPARAYRPKDKPHVENAVGILQKEFFQEYRHYTFTSLHELNQKLREYLNNKMHELMPSRKVSRANLFELELEVMQDLPDKKFEFFEYKKCKVHPDCHIRHQKNFYSVPFQFVGKEIEIKFNNKMLYAFSETDEVAIHQVYQGHGHYVTNENHYPEKKLLETNYHIKSSILKAKNIGPNTELLMNQLLSTPRNHPLRNLTKAFGILGLVNKFTKEAIEYGCESALLSNKPSYKYIESCAKNYRPLKEKISLLPDRQMAFVCLQGGLL